MNRVQHKHVRVDLRLDAHIALALEAEANRLHELLIGLKKHGMRAQARGMKEHDVASLALAIGLERIHGMTFEQFEAELCRLVRRQPGNE
jgi:hypothetical protein